MGFDKRIIKMVQSRLRESQEEKFPYFLDKSISNNLIIQVNKHVFSPKHFLGHKFFIQNFPNFKKKAVLEIGSGHGLIACYLAKNGAKKVLATDINKFAVENTKINAKLNNLKNIDARISDVFENIKDTEKFDIIFWNAPFILEKTKEKMKPEEYGAFDPEYKSISKFILEGKNYLTKNGALYLGLGDKGVDLKLIDEFIKKANLKKEIVTEENFSPGIKKESNKLLKFRLKLIKLTSR